MRRLIVELPANETATIRDYATCITKLLGECDVMQPQYKYTLNSGKVINQSVRMITTFVLNRAQEDQAIALLEELRQKHSRIQTKFMLESL